MATTDKINLTNQITNHDLFSKEEEYRQLLNIVALRSAFFSFVSSCIQGNKSDVVVSIDKGNQNFRLSKDIKRHSQLVLSQIKSDLAIAGKTPELCFSRMATESMVEFSAIDPGGEYIREWFKLSNTIKSNISDAERSIADYCGVKNGYAYREALVSLRIKHLKSPVLKEVPKKLKQQYIDAYNFTEFGKSHEISNYILDAIDLIYSKLQIAMHDFCNGYYRWTANQALNCSWGTGPEFDDSFHDGVTGLIQAIDFYDINKQVRFSTFATSKIKQRIARSHQDTGTLVRIPVRQGGNNSKILKFRDKCESAGHSLPSFDAISRETGLSENVVRSTLITIGQAVSSIDSSVNSDSEAINLHEVVAAENNFSDVEESSSSQMLKKMFSDAELTDTERDSLLMKHGMANFDEHSTSEIAEILDISAELVRQAIRRAVRKLRAYCDEQDMELSDFI